MVTVGYETGNNRGTCMGTNGGDTEDNIKSTKNNEMKP